MSLMSNLTAILFTNIPVSRNLLISMKFSFVTILLPILTGNSIGSWISAFKGSSFEKMLALSLASSSAISDSMS